VIYGVIYRGYWERMH